MMAAYEVGLTLAVSGSSVLVSSRVRGWSATEAAWPRGPAHAPRPPGPEGRGSSCRVWLILILHMMNTQYSRESLQDLFGPFPARSSQYQVETICLQQFLRKKLQITNNVYNIDQVSILI